MFYYVISLVFVLFIISFIVIIDYHQVIFTPTGPCLVEVGSRCHGGEASWMPIANECVGYNQIDATLNCYLRPDRFDELPDVPKKLLKEGSEVFLVSHQSGVVKDITGIESIRVLSSFNRMEMMTQPGSVIKPTIDCFTRPGAIQLVNAEAMTRLPVLLGRQQ